MNFKLNLKPIFFVLVLAASLLQNADGGPIAYGFCQAGCCTAWVACYAAAGLVAGTVTAGLGAPAAALACNAQQGFCMAACAAMAIAPIP